MADTCVSYCNACKWEFYSELETCSRCQRHTQNGTERRVRVRAKVDELVREKKTRLERRERYRQWLVARKTAEQVVVLGPDGKPVAGAGLAPARGVTDYEAWDFWEPESEDDESAPPPAEPSDPAFRAMEADLAERQRKREEQLRASNALKVRGNDEFKAGRYAAALSLYNDAVDACRGEKALYCNRAACQLKLRNWEAAAKDCTTVVDIWQYLDNKTLSKSDKTAPIPLVVKALLRRAEARASLRQYAGATADCEMALIIRPGLVDAVRLREQLVAQAKDLELLQAQTQPPTSAPAPTSAPGPVSAATLGTGAAATTTAPSAPDASAVHAVAGSAAPAGVDADRGADADLATLRSFAAASLAAAARAVGSGDMGWIECLSSGASAGVGAVSAAADSPPPDYSAATAATEAASARLSQSLAIVVAWREAGAAETLTAALDALSRRGLSWPGATAAADADAADAASDAGRGWALLLPLLKCLQSLADNDGAAADLHAAGVADVISRLLGHLRAVEAALSPDPSAPGTSSTGDDAPAGLSVDVAARKACAASPAHSWLAPITLAQERAWGVLASLVACNRVRSSLAASAASAVASKTAESVGARVLRLLCVALARAADMTKPPATAAVLAAPRESQLGYQLYAASLLAHEPNMRLALTRGAGASAGLVESLFRLLAAPPLRAVTAPVPARAPAGSVLWASPSAVASVVAVLASVQRPASAASLDAGLSRALSRQDRALQALCNLAVDDSIRAATGGDSGNVALLARYLQTTVAAALVSGADAWGSFIVNVDHALGLAMNLSLAPGVVTAVTDASPALPALLLALLAPPPRAAAGPVRATGLTLHTFVRATGLLSRLAAGSAAVRAGLSACGALSVLLGTALAATAAATVSLPTASSTSASAAPAAADVDALEHLHSLSDHCVRLVAVLSVAEPAATSAELAALASPALALPAAAVTEWQHAARSTTAAVTTAAAAAGAAGAGVWKIEGRYPAGAAAAIVEARVRELLALRPCGASTEVAVAADAAVAATASTGSALTLLLSAWSPLTAGNTAQLVRTLADSPPAGADGGAWARQLSAPAVAATHRAVLGGACTMAAVLAGKPALPAWLGFKRKADTAVLELTAALGGGGSGGQGGALQGVKLVGTGASSAVDALVTLMKRGDYEPWAGAAKNAAVACACLARKDESCTKQLRELNAFPALAAWSKK
jgi:hypothetical protein